MLYKIFNGPMPTTVSQVAVATGTGLKTLLQVKVGSTGIIKVREWGISFDGSAAATPGIVELCVTDVAATVTAAVQADVHKYDADATLGGNPLTSILVGSTTGTGYTASSEGSISSCRQLDVALIAPTSERPYQFPLGVSPYVGPSEFLRIRVKFVAGVNAICWVLIEA